KASVPGRGAAIARAQALGARNRIAKEDAAVPARRHSKLGSKPEVLVVLFGDEPALAFPPARRVLLAGEDPILHDPIAVEHLHPAAQVLSVPEGLIGNPRVWPLEARCRAPEDDEGQGRGKQLWAHETRSPWTWLGTWNHFHRVEPSCLLFSQT